MSAIPNIWLSQSEEDLEKQFGGSDFFIAHLDGGKIPTLRQFYEEVADVLEFPLLTYNLDALNDSLNDLQWLEDKKIVLYLTNTESLLRRERDPLKLSSIIQILDATAEDWKWVESDEGTDRKEFYIVLEASSRIGELLKRELIEFGYLNERSNK
ncbi:MAG: barstar family protein [Rudanella sp.]|nr:barstar family protein [Rudanella sp.]